MVGRYLKNNFFFFVGCFCAIVGGSKSHCIVISYFIFLTKLAEIGGLWFGLLWVSYIGHFLSAIINYINIITAINYVATL